MYHLHTAPTAAQKWTPTNKTFDKEESNTKERITYVRSRLPDDELLCQLAEEADELGHAALKLRRALMGVNPTPVTASEALDELVEEISDVALSLTLLGYGEPEGLLAGKELDFSDYKLQRWVKRLKGEDHGSLSEQN